MVGANWSCCVGCGGKIRGVMMVPCPECGSRMVPIVVGDGFHSCPKCGVPVPDERWQLLGVEECTTCTPQKRKPRGAYDYPPQFHEL